MDRKNPQRRRLPCSDWCAICPDIVRTLPNEDPCSNCPDCNISLAAADDATWD